MNIDDRFLNRLGQLLKAGPIVIGESHDEAPARFVVKQLIKRGAVSYLSIESPIAPQSMSRADGEVNDTGEFYRAVSSYKNKHYPINEIAAYAKKKNVRVYCHDMPAIRSPLNFAANRNDLTEYPTYAAQFLPVRMNGKLPIESKMAQLVAVRNDYSANYLKAQFGNGVRVLFGLVILAGSDHLKAKGSGGANRTLQAYLGIAQDRAFVIDEKTAQFLEEDDD